jgi:hypothetical protein
MKKLLLTILLALVSISAMAEWTKIDETANAIQYIDLSTVLRHGNKVKMWSLVDYKTAKILEITNLYLKSHRKNMTANRV